MLSLDRTVLRVPALAASALLLPVALIAGCSPAPAPGTAPATAPSQPAAPVAQAPADPHADHAHGPNDGHDHGASSATSAKEGAQAAADASLAAGGQQGQAPTPEQLKMEMMKKQQAAQAAANDPHAGHDHAQGADDAGFAPDPNSKARLSYEFGTDNHSFGKVLQGDVLRHTFALKSSGEEDLVIRQAKPTCGCTVAQPMVEQADGELLPYTYGTPIPPGRKIEMQATLQTVNKRGHASSRINISSNDPRGMISVGLDADVEPFFNINPPVLNFNMLSAQDVASDRATISTMHGERVRLEAHTANAPQGLKIELKALDADAEGKATRWELSVTAGPGLVEGQLAYVVQLKSDLQIPGADPLPNGTRPVYETQTTVMARVTGMIDFAPQFVSLGLIKPGMSLSKSVRVTCHDRQLVLPEPKISLQGRDGGAWELADAFTTVVRPVPNENAFDVEITLNGMPETLNGSFSGQLVIETGYAQKPELKLPITGVCRGTSVIAPVGGSPR